MHDAATAAYSLEILQVPQMTDSLMETHRGDFSLTSSGVSNECNSQSSGRTCDYNGNAEYKVHSSAMQLTL